MSKQVILLSVALFLSLLGFSQHTVEGVVLYHFNPSYPIEGVFVGLYNNQNEMVGMDQSDQLGKFSFENVPAGTYTCRATTTLAGAPVTFQQAFLIWMHAMGYVQLNDIQKKAADVDDSEQVNFFDVQYILTNYFVYNQPFPAGKWQFTELTVEAGMKTGGGPIGGVKVGDVDGVFVPTGRDGDYSTDVINSTERIARKGDVVRLPVKVEGVESTTGFGMVLNYDPGLIEVVRVIPKESNTTYSVSNDQIRLSCSLFDQAKSTRLDNTLFEVEARLLIDLETEKQAFTIDGSSHVLNQDGKVAVDVMYNLPVLKNAASNGALNLYPNPFTEKVTLTLETNESSTVELTVFDMQGRKMLNQRLYLPKGFSESSFTFDELPAGCYQLVLTNGLNQKILHNQRLVRK